MTEMASTSNRFLKTRQSLVARLKDMDDQDIWREFLDTYWGLLYSVAIQSGLTETEAQDAVQETVISVAKTMPGFKYNPAVCSFKTWLRHLAQKRITDQLRRRPPAGAVTVSPPPDASSRTDPMERLPDLRSVDLDAVWEHQWRKHVLNAALATVKSKTRAEQFQIFNFHVLKNWPVKRVAALLGVTAAQVYLAKFRISRMIQQEAKRLEKSGF